MQSFNVIQIAITAINSLLGRIVAVGEVSQLDTQKHRVKVVLPGHDNVVTDFLPVLSPRALGMTRCCLPKIGEQVWCLFIPIGGLERGCVIGSSFNAEDLPPGTNEHQVFWQFADGTTFYYDEDKSECKLNMPQGTLEITTPNTTINSDVQINGTLDVSDDITGAKEVIDKVRSMSGDRNKYNQHIHPHGNPNTGKTPQQQ